MRPASTHIVATCLLVGAATSPARAISRSDARVIVLRADDVESSIAADVDRVLIDSLSADAGFGRAEVSPIPLSDLRLAVGCADVSRLCLSRIAGTVDADVVILRELVTGGAEPVLALTSFDAIGVGAPISVEEPLEEGPDRDVPELVRRLYALDAAQAPAPIRILPEGERESSSGVSTAGWVSVGLGAVTLAAAGVTAILAEDALDDYRHATITTESDADRALSTLDTAQDRSLAANILFGAGGALVAVGATLLVVDLTGSDERETLTLSAGTTPGGLLLHGGGAW